MNKLDFNFVQRYKFPWFAALFLLLSMAIFFIKVAVWLQWRERIQHDEAQIGQLKQVLQARTRVAEVNSAAQRIAMEERTKDESKVVNALQYPWNRIFSTFEQADTEKVAVLSFAHDATTTDTRIMVEATDVGGVEEFLRKMNDSSEDGMAAGWYLASYQLQTQNQPPTIIGIILQKR